ncbi:type II CAAX endopeptidase family protein [Zunongwangia sp. F260]|uniref:Type II CAAX endopeptidase family protein n=1 Tax=Autumnicola lenta TaxID=3075593 RepID=A0ABU3CGG0_9FLAO|nr:type II CAAX endopeptidase family protein [Zunongwangia sp. F260]MDT0645440.1 type II CAAX endopeptidase family protein [Zunongwangia sp. F260]
MNKTEYVMKGWQRILLIILPYIFIVGIFQLIGGLISGADITNIQSEKTSIQQLIISVFDFTGTFLILWFFMKFVDKEDFVRLGFGTKNRLKEFIVGILLGLLIMVFAFVLLNQLQEILFLRINLDLTELIISIILFTIVAVVEETLFRGYILRNLMSSFNKYFALIISSILFSAMHSFNSNVDLFSLLNLFLAGILLGLSYLYTKNLWFPIALHLSWNLFQTLLGFNVSGRDTYSIIEFKINEENFMNGGAFGFEGSYLSLFAQILSIASIGFYYNRKKLTTTA